MKNELTKRKLQRHERGGRASFPSSNLPAEVAKINKFYSDQIGGLESVRRQSGEIRDDFGRSQELKFEKESRWSDKLHNWEGGITDIRIAANNVRKKGEVEALKAEADELGRKSKLYATITGNLLNPIAAQAGKVFQAYQQAKALEGYTPNDFNEHSSFEARDEAQKTLMGTFHDDMERLGTNYKYDDKYNAAVKISGESNWIQEGFRAEDWIEAEKIIIESTREKAINSKGKNIWSKHTINALLESRANAYMLKYDINPKSKAGVKIRKATQRWSTTLVNNITLAEKGNENIKQLTAGAKALFIAINDKDYDGATKVFNHMILLTRNGVIQGGVRGEEWLTPQQHNLEKPQAAAYLTSYILQANPNIDREGLNKILDNIKVPLTGKYKHLNKSDEEVNSAWGKLLKTGLVKPEQETTWKSNYRKRYSDKAPSWGAFLGDNGYTEIVGSALDKKASGNIESRESSAKVSATSDLNNYRKRYEVPKLIKGKPNPDKLDLTDYSTGGDREQLALIASNPATHEIVSKGIFQDLDWDFKRQSTFAAEENYKAALAVGDKDEAAYYFSKLSEESREYYRSKNQGPEFIQGFYNGGGDLDSLENKFRGHFSLKYGLNYNQTDKVPAIVDELTEHAKSRFWDYRNQISSLKPGEKGYIEGDYNINKEAERLVLDDIDEGVKSQIGIFRVEDTGADGTLRLRFTYFDHGTHGNRTKLANNADAFYDTFIGKSEYDPETVAKTITPIERGELEKAAVTGNAYEYVVPENLIEVSKKFGIPLNIVIDNVLEETPLKTDTTGKVISGDENWEIKWPVSNENLVSTITGQQWVGSDESAGRVLACYNAQSITGRFPCRPELQELLEARYFRSRN